MGILVTDLYCTFGWKKSPYSYRVAGAAINHLYARAAPTWPDQPTCAKGFFDAKAWCDVATEADVGTRLYEANLGLSIDDHCLRENVFYLVQGRKTPWTELEPQCIDSFHASREDDEGADMDPRGHRPRTNNQDAAEQPCRQPKTRGDMYTSSSVILPANSGTCTFVVTLRVNSDFARSGGGFKVKPQLYPDGPIHIKVNYHVHMDAGDRGLCVLFPAHKQFFQFEFDNDQQQLIQEFNQSGNIDFGINVREIMSVVYANLRWGRSWKSGDGNPESHVKLWFDNTSAVAWKADVNHNTMQLGAYAVYLWQFGMSCENKGNSYSTICGKLCGIR
ncbi:hypothetical protein L917_12683, partial [Phytophthora nicotianae]